MANLIIKDFGWTRISRELKLIDNSFTKVGYPENAQVKSPTKKVKGKKISSNISEVATIAAFNEFGTSQAKSSRSGGSLVSIPARATLGPSLDENLENLNQLKAKLYIEIVNDRITLRKALSIIGEFMTAKTKRKIRDLKSPPNSLVTIKKKKSSNPLIDTAQMINSVTHTEVLK